MEDLAVGDFNLDGRLDLAAANLSAGLMVFPGNGNGTFGPVISVPLNSPVQGVVSHALLQTTGALDLNGDRLPDLVMFSADGNLTPVISTYLSNTLTSLIRTAPSPSITGQPVTLSASVAGLQTGLLVLGSGSVQFYNGQTPLGSLVPIVNGTATLTISSLPQGLDFVRAGYVNAAGIFQGLSPAVAHLVQPAACGTVVTGQLTINPGGFRLDRSTNQFVQTVTVANTSAQPIAGPISFVAANLSANAGLLGAAGKTSCVSPAQQPYIDLGVCPAGSLAPGQTVSVDLHFSNPTRTPITYSPMVVAELSAR
jgi:TM2 domain-containing membrane protein YozV